MSTGLTIRPDASFDFLSLGALVHRLDPGIIPFRKATECRIHVSGGEFNVAANLADCFGLRTGIATAMVDYPIGDLIAERVRAMGVTPFYKRFKHDGVTRPEHGHRATATAATACARRSSSTTARNEAAAQLKPGDFDWKAIFAGGVRWFHSGGIFAALSETTAELIIEGMQAAKAAGAVVSFDLNYRAKLWKICRRRRHAPSRSLAPHRRERRCAGRQRGGPADGPRHPRARRSPRKSKLDPSAFFGMIDRVRREVSRRSRSSRRRCARCTRPTGTAGARWPGSTARPTSRPTCELDVFDRVGGGDGFAAGFFYGLLTGESPEEALSTSAGRTARCSTTFPGDTTMATVEQVRAFAKGGSARIQR